MPIKNKNFIVIRVYDEWGFDFEQGQIIRDIIIAHKATDFEFINPGTFWIYYLKNKENDLQCGNLISKLNSLKSKNEGF